jgi:hypothetical protein
MSFNLLVIWEILFGLGFSANKAFDNKTEALFIFNFNLKFITFSLSHLSQAERFEPPNLFA